MRLNLIFLLFYQSVVLVSAQNNYVPSLRITRATSPITIDGVLDELAWQTPSRAANFWQYFPSDTVQAQMPTEVYMTYDEQNLYVAVKSYSEKDNYITQSLRRDYRANGNDNVTLVFDTFDDGTNAFVFGMNAYGVRREALISEGGRARENFGISWDNKWYGEVELYHGFWVAEFAIPFKTLRYKEGSTKWGFNCYRFDTQTNERSTWVRIPRNQLIMNLAFMGDLVWDKPLEKSGANVSMIPYVTTDMTQDYEDGTGKPSVGYELGGDAKIGITSGLNLDLTFNPNFAQVEVDQQVTNLDRFEIFFPERRQFFLENADLFSSFGSRRTTPFFSRRIGVSQDTSTGQNIQNPILYGARLSGKLDNDWRLGLLNMQTAKDEDNGLPSFNYTVAAIQRRVSSRSNIGLIFVNKQTFEDLDTSSEFDPYNRVLGIDYNLASSDNVWTGKAFLHRAFTVEDTSNSKFTHGFRLQYNIRKWQLKWMHQYVGDGYDAQVGFVRRRGFYRINPEARINFYPSSSKINLHGFGLDVDMIWMPTLGTLRQSDHQIELFWDANFTDNSRLRVSAQNEYIYLFDSFDPSGTDSQELPVGSHYYMNTLQANYFSDRRKLFYFTLSPSFGQYYNGTRLSLESELTFRFQPYGSIAINTNYNKIDLPSPYASANLLLIGPRIDITFSKDVFFTTFIQYNNQIDNVNINARFQWRFNPVSDFFLVYTDNYYATDFATKNRAFVAKLTYWFNL